MVTGAPPVSRRAEIVGVGYRVMCGRRGVFVGYSHPVAVEPPEGITFHRYADQIPRAALTSSGWRGRRQPPQAAQAGPVQGQGRALPGEVIRRKVGKAGK
jgi:large subunit ribosomal protein L6